MCRAVALEIVIRDSSVTPELIAACEHSPLKTLLCRRRRDHQTPNATSGMAAAAVLSPLQGQSGRAAVIVISEEQALPVGPAGRVFAFE